MKSPNGKSCVVGGHAVLPFIYSLCFSSVPLLIPSHHASSSGLPFLRQHWYNNIHSLLFPTARCLTAPHFHSAATTVPQSGLTSPCRHSLHSCHSYKHSLSRSLQQPWVLSPQSTMYSYSQPCLGPRMAIPTLLPANRQHKLTILDVDP